MVIWMVPTLIVATVVPAAAWVALVGFERPFWLLVVFCAAAGAGSGLLNEQQDSINANRRIHGRTARPQR